MKMLILVAALAITSTGAMAACTKADIAGTWEVTSFSTLPDDKTYSSCVLRIKRDGTFAGFGCPAGELHQISPMTCRWTMKIGAFEWEGVAEHIDPSSTLKPNVMMGGSRINQQFTVGTMFAYRKFCGSPIDCQ